MYVLQRIKQLNKTDVLSITEIAQGTWLITWEIHGMLKEHKDGVTKTSNYISRTFDCAGHSYVLKCADYRHKLMLMMRSLAHEHRFNKVTAIYRGEKVEMKESNGQPGPAEWTSVCDLSIFGSCKSETLNIQLIVENRPPDVAVEGKLAHFSKMLDDQLLTDVHFIVGGKKFGAHLAVLAAASPVMAAMFGRENYKEGQSKSAKIDDADPEVFHQMLRYLYTGVAPKMSKYLEDLYVVADKYQISTLKMECEQLMVSSLTVDNVVRRLELAYALSASTLLEAALEHVTQHMDDIWNRPEWKNLGERNYDVFFLAMDRVHLRENSRKLEHVPPPAARQPILASSTPVHVSAFETVLQAIVRALP